MENILTFVNDWAINIYILIGLVGSTAGTFLGIAGTIICQAQYKKYKAKNKIRKVKNLFNRD